MKKKTNYLETKISSYNREGNVNSHDVEQKIKVNSSEVVDLRVVEKDNKKNKDQGIENKKKKKISFFFSR